MGEKTLVMGSMGEKRAVIDLSTNNRTECVLDTVGNSRLEGGGGWGNIGAVGVPMGSNTAWNSGI